ncbi:MAG: outer membrane beta-barrel protein [Bacteroidota bacterium]
MMKKTLFFLCVFAILTAGKSFSQPADSTSKLKFSGYVDAYYAYYTDSVGRGNFQKFPSVSPRSEQFGLNAICLTAQYDDEKVRGTVTLHYGDIPVSAWSGTFNNIMEAHGGVRIINKLWIDAGFFRTHVGTEGLLPKENITSSVGVPTYYEPYFESGVRLNYNPTEKIAINLFLLNGFNIYQDNNSKKSFGLLATYALGDKGNIGISNYTGDDTPGDADSISHLRIFQNLFINYQFNNLKVQLGGDYAVQENSDIAFGNKSAAMYSGVLGLKYQAVDVFAVYARGEIFNDPEGFLSGIIIDKKSRLTGLKLMGGTFGIEYKPMEGSYIRLETRQLIMDEDQQIFKFDGIEENHRTEILLNLGVSF